MAYENFEENEMNVYDENARTELVDDDEITPEEEGFMKGYEGNERYCANCGVLIEEEAAIQKEIDGKQYFFCSEECAETFED